MTPLQLIAIVSILLGLLMLVMSMRHARFLIGHGERQSTGWKVLFVLIGFFIAGYMGFAYSLGTKNTTTILEMVVSLIFLGGGAFVMLIVQLSVYTVKNLIHLAEQERHHALHDPLTGLPNRLFFNQQANRAVQLANRNHEKLAMLVMDLNRFKEINDTLGHESGDVLLKHIAPRLEASVRSTDIVCRMGGDEFAILLYGCGYDEVAGIVREIAEQVRTPVMLGNNNISVGVSIGISLFPEHGLSLPVLLRRADIAMYESKRNGLDFALYATELDQEFMRRLVLINALRESIDKEQLVLLYQPRIDIRTRQPMGVEALIRWLHPEMGNISPEIFIPLAEQAGLMRPLTTWIITRVLEQMEQWQQAGIDTDMSINVSARNLADTDFPNLVRDLLADSQIEASRITLEVTESSMITNPAVTRDILNQLAALGFRISIDDFGTGYSSMQYLKNLPTREVKIDKTFVMHMLVNEGDAVIVHTTIGLAHNLGYQIVAEGVDSEEALDLLEILGCDIAQGYYISRPLSPNDLAWWLNNYQSNQNGSATANKLLNVTH